MLNLKLTRPLCAYDIESTGTSPSKDSIVQLCVKKFYPDGTHTVHTSLVNPEMLIPAEATETHHITDEMVAKAPTFKQIAKSIFKVLDGADVLTFNGNMFDNILLSEEFAREGIIWPASNMKSIDGSVIFKKHEERTLTAAMRFYCDKDHEGAHAADADVDATVEVLDAQLDRYDDIKDMTVDELHDYCVYDRDKNNVDLAGKIARNENGDFIFTFGKNKGLRVIDDLKYCEWMLKPDSDFTLQTKSIVQGIYNNKKGVTQELPLI